MKKKETNSNWRLEKKFYNFFCSKQKITFKSYSKLICGRKLLK